MADLRDGGQALLEVGDGGGVFTVHGDLDEDLEAQADRGGVDDGPVTADHPGAFQFAQPPVAGGDAEPGALGEFGDVEPPQRAGYDGPPRRAVSAYRPMA